jgi:hypothetical protein
MRIMDPDTIEKIENVVTRLTPLDSCPQKADAQKQRRKKLVEAIVKIVDERERRTGYAPIMELKRTSENY